MHFRYGTLINCAAIVLAGILGRFFGKRIKDRVREALTEICGISVIFLAIAGAMEGMLSVEDGKLISQHSMMVVICLVLGTLLGELLNIEGGISRFGEWLKQKTGNAKDVSFVEAFITASCTVCIGAMAVIGSIEDGINGNWSILGVKSILDFIIILVMTASLGKGCAFSAISVFLFQGCVTLLASLLSPLMTETALAYLSMIGNILIFCVGINLLFNRKLRVANMLPAILFAVAAAFLP